MNTKEYKHFGHARNNGSYVYVENAINQWEKNKTVGKLIYIAKTSEAMMTQVKHDDNLNRRGKN